MRKNEKTFEARLANLLKEEQFAVINVAMPRFGGHALDLVAMRNGFAYPIEVKGKKTPYPDKQRKMQLKMFSDSNTLFFVIRQSKKRGMMSISAPNLKYSSDKIRINELKQALIRWIE